MNLTTTGLGLELQNPFVPSASPLSRSLDSAKALEDAGAGAIVMYSLFEETIHHEERQMDRFLVDQAIGFGEADSFFPEPPSYSSSLDDYLEHLAALKRALGIPVIASLNGVSPAGWTGHATAMEQAAAKSSAVLRLVMSMNRASSTSTRPRTRAERISPSVMRRVAAFNLFMTSTSPYSRQRSMDLE